MLRQVRALFLQGLAVVLPVGLTTYLVWWLASSLELVMGRVLQWVLPESLYVTGMGLVVGAIAVVGIGILMHGFFLRELMELVEELILRVPLVKTVYGSIKDVVSLVADGSIEKSMNETVFVPLNENARLMGFVTRKKTRELFDEGREDEFAVYLPMSYQLGGYTVFMKKDELEATSISAEDGLRIVLTAGVSGKTESGPAEDEPAAGPPA